MKFIECLKIAFFFVAILGSIVSVLLFIGQSVFTLWGITGLVASGLIFVVFTIALMIYQDSN